MPTLNLSSIVTRIKSITAKKIFKFHLEIKEKLFFGGGSLWTSGYYANTVGRYANEEKICKESRQKI